VRARGALNAWTTEGRLTVDSLTLPLLKSREESISRTEDTDMSSRESDPPQVLLVGESWVAGGSHIKGSDVFDQPRYEEGGIELVRALESAEIGVTRVPAHLASRDFPASVEGLAPYGAVIVSDVGADSFELTDDCLAGRRSVSRLRVLAEWVAGGGALLMVGGYMSFSGIQGRAGFARSPLAEVLPVDMLDHDDRVERPDGVEPLVVDPSHPIVAGLPSSWPFLLGYNEVQPKERSSVLVAVDQSPLLVVGTHGRGRVAAFSSDCSPHWASHEFLAWAHYAALFEGLVRWLARASTQDQVRPTRRP
jgi:uncharacterized membrane protein